MNSTTVDEHLDNQLAITTYILSSLFVGINSALCLIALIGVIARRKRQPLLAKNPLLTCVDILSKLVLTLLIGTMNMFEGDDYEYPCIFTVFITVMTNPLLMTSTLFIVLRLLLVTRETVTKVSKESKARRIYLHFLTFLLSNWTMIVAYLVVICIHLILAGIVLPIKNLTAGGRCGFIAGDPSVYMPVVIELIVAFVILFVMIVLVLIMRTVDNRKLIRGLMADGMKLGIRKLLMNVITILRTLPDAYGILRESFVKGVIYVAANIGILLIVYSQRQPARKIHGNYLLLIALDIDIISTLYDILRSQVSSQMKSIKGEDPRNKGDLNSSSSQLGSMQSSSSVDKFNIALEGLRDASTDLSKETFASPLVEHLYYYALKELSVENLLFIIDVNKYISKWETMNGEERGHYASKIVKQYVGSNAINEVNAGSNTVQYIKDKMSKQVYTHDLFDYLIRDARNNLYDTWCRFEKSPLYSSAIDRMERRNKIEKSASMQ